MKTEKEVAVIPVVEENSSRRIRYKMGKEWKDASMYIYKREIGVGGSYEDGWGRNVNDRPEYTSRLWTVDA